MKKSKLKNQIMNGRNRKNFLIIIVFFQGLFLFAQSDTLKKFSFSGYGEIYYSYDFSNPANHEKSSFIYNHKRHNEINANLLLAKANYTDQVLSLIHI